jgi:hypothetical protein
MDKVIPEKVRPVIPPSLVTPLQRWATAHSVNTTAAVALLLNIALKKEKFLK